LAMRKTKAPAGINRWLAVPLDADIERSINRLVETEDVAHVAVMPDAHLANDVCIGVVMATRQRLFPAAVGRDIGCGMSAVRFEGKADALRANR